MPIERKSGLFYELLIRGVWDPVQGQLGSISTYQLMTGTALVDTDTNRLAAPYAPDPARDLTRDEAVAYLDERFADFLEQITSERAAAAAAAVAAATAAREAADAAADEIAALKKSAEDAAALAADEAAVLHKRIEDLQSQLSSIAALAATA